MSSIELLLMGLLVGVGLGAWLRMPHRGEGAAPTLNSNVACPV